MTSKVRYIPLSMGQVAIVDEADYDYLMQWKWHAFKSKKTFYALRHEEGNHRKQIRMHAVIFASPDGLPPDHENRNGLDNRRDNLRPATPKQQCANQGVRVDNKIGFKGVRQCVRGKGYQARIRIDGKPKHLGTRPTPEEAARVYDEAAREHYGEYAYTNFPTTTTQLSPQNGA